MEIAIIDYGVGNHQSVANAIRFLGYEVTVSADLQLLTDADAYVLPGVGAFGEAMKNILKLGLLDVLAQQVLDNKKPMLGICLGMQILAEYSDEGGRHKGLGFIPGEVLKLQSRAQCPVPHVGWNNLCVKSQSPLFTRTDDGASFFFDHSYHFVCDSSFVSSSCQYGEEITASVQKGNVFGVQFHPEKSQNSGLKLFRSFFNYVEQQTIKQG